MDRLYWKRHIGRAWGCLNRGRTRSLILIYHSVDGGPVSTIRERFEAQMAWLAENTEVVDLETLIDGIDESEGKPLVGLTFDDGYRSLRDVAAPALKQYSFPATVYLNSGYIGDDEHVVSDAGMGHYPDEQFMTWKEVAELQAAGWCIGSHGVEHLDLTVQTQAVVELQLAKSRDVITEQLGRPCDHFSYTWGHHNRQLRDSVAAAGYRSAVAGMHAPVTKHSNPFALPRLDIRREYELEDFAAIVRGDWDYLGWLQKVRNWRL